MLILRQIFVDVENVNKCKKHILNMLSFEKKLEKKQGSNSTDRKIICSN